MTSDLPEMRASDADRDAIAERLRDGFAEGRLTTEEFEERLEAAYASRTRSELVPLVRDLPQPGEDAALSVPGADEGGPSLRKRWADRYGATATSRSGIAIMGGFARKGSWVMPRLFRCIAFWGGGEIDLREARFEDRDVVIKVTAIMGGIDITVPHDAEVEVNGIGIMGDFDQSASGAGVSGAPRIVISGLAFWAGVDVKRKPPAGDDGKKLRGGSHGPHGPHSLH